MTQGYDSRKAKAFNQAIQNGSSINDAYIQAGISADEEGNYGVNNDPLSRNFGQLGPADENTISARTYEEPESTASYGTSYSQPAQSFAGLNLQPQAQDTTGFTTPAGAANIQTAPLGQDLNVYPPQDVPVTTSGLTGVQFDIGGLPVAQTTPTDIGAFNVAPGAVVSGFGTPQFQDTTPRATSDVFDGASLYRAQTNFDNRPGTFTAVDVDPTVDPSANFVSETTFNNGRTVTSPEPVDDTAGTPVYSGPSFNAASLRANIDNADTAGYGTGFTLEDPSIAEVSVGSGTESGTNPATVLAQNSNTIREQRRSVNNQDWRVRLSLAPQSTYLYNDAEPGTILFPLRNTDGIIFPYTPTVQTSYTANYSSYDLTHSNYKGYFYQNSSVNTISISGTFTAQDTAEADYLLAVIHFLRSATKMFYGQDQQAGAPPPVMFLSGFGNYQFREHPVLLTSFNYSLPNRVDYIRCTSVNQVGINLLTRRNRVSGTTNPLITALNRLSTLINPPPIGASPTQTNPPQLGGDSPTYVPTEMEISISLLPVQTRQQVSKQFSVKQFANGDLLRGGFW